MFITGCLTMVLSLLILGICYCVKISQEHKCQDAVVGSIIVLGISAMITTIATAITGYHALEEEAKIASSKPQVQQVESMGGGFENEIQLAKKER